MCKQRLKHGTFDLGSVELATADQQTLKAVDCRLANLQGPITFVIDNTTDAGVRVQAYGAMNPDTRLATNLAAIQGAVSVDAGKRGYINIPMNSSAFPYLGLAMTRESAPSRGNVKAVAFMQFWVDE